MQQIIRLSDEYFSQALSVLQSAYLSNPIFKTLLNHELPGYEQRLRATVRELIARHFAEVDPIFGVIDEQNNLTSCACITSQSIKSEISSSWLWRLKMFTTAGIGATSEFLQYIDQVDAYIPSSPHRLLTLFAVEQGHQHEGIGDKLFEAILKFCCEDEESTGLYVVTDHSNFDYFARFDATVIHSFSIADTNAQLTKLTTEFYSR